MMSVLRKQMEVVEEKLGSQISRVQQQSDRLREAAFSRVDAKMGNMESLQPKIDRRLAELSGNYKGLSDEMQAQIRRLDAIDNRLLDWRHQLEEEFRSKFLEIEQGQQQLSSSVRVATSSSEDGLKRCNRRLVRLEGLVDERLASAEDVNQSLLNLHARLTEVEDFRNQDSAIFRPEDLAVAVPSVDQAPPDDSAIVALESRMSDASQKLDRWQHESHDVHARLEAQEERLKSLRTLVETKEEHYRWLSDRVERTDWEGRFKELKSQLHDLEQHRLGSDETLKLAQQKVDRQEDAHEALANQLRRLHDKGVFLEDDLRTCADGACQELVGNQQDLPTQVMECVDRLNESEKRLEALGHDVEQFKTDSQLDTLVVALVEQLKQVAPKVVEHDATVKDLTDKVGKLDSEQKEQQASAAQTSRIVPRLSRLEAEVSRMKAELEGADEAGTNLPPVPEDEELKDTRVSSPLSSPSGRRKVAAPVSATE